MDFQRIVDGIGAMACVISVQKQEDGGYGEIRIAAGNKAYIDSIEQQQGGVQLLDSVFRPNSLYTDYLPRDLNFEVYCARAAIDKKCLHSYVRPERFDVWFNLTFLPLVPDEEDLCFCVYIMEISQKADASMMTNISGELASKVLEISIKIDGTADFKAAMNDVIMDLRALCGAKRCCILLIDAVSRSCSVLCEDISSNTLQKPMTEIMDEHFYDLVETWEQTIAGSSCLIIKNEKEMEIVAERNPKWYEGLHANHVKSMVLFPLKFNGELLGYIWATNFDAENAEKIKETLEVTTFILGSEIANYLLLKRLRILSSQDLLTGVMNRNEMNGYVERLSCGEEGRGKTAGVVFADLNGLKYVNDSEGHGAGDQLLKDAASALREVFAAGEIFRAGGDEFTVIELGVTAKELEAKVEMLRRVSAGYDRVSFAVGWDVAENAADVRRALRIADEKMYEDKALFYKTNPEIMR